VLYYTTYREKYFSSSGVAETAMTGRLLGKTMVPLYSTVFHKGSYKYSHFFCEIFYKKKCEYFTAKAHSPLYNDRRLKEINDENWGDRSFLGYFALHFQTNVG
jgi:hypothetical protein